MEKQAGIDTSKLDDEKVAIFDKLSEFKRFTPNQH